jgi:hypothetical protein
VSAPPLRNNFNGSAGATISTADTGYGDPWTTVVIGSGAPVTYVVSPGRGSAMQVVEPAVYASSYVDWRSLGTVIADLYGRFYLYLTAYPTGSNLIAMQYRTAAGGACMRLVLNQAGTIQVEDAALAVVSTGAKVLPLNQWVRIEWRVRPLAGGAGEIEWKLFSTVAPGDGPDGVTPSETFNNTGLTLGGNADQIRLGMTANAGPPSFVGLFDDLAVSLTGWIGSAVTVSIPAVYPSGSLVSITGQATCGDGHVAGGIAASQFGTITTRLGGPPQTQAVTGIPSPQAFGTIKTAQTRPVSAVNSAQAFGVPTPKATRTLAVNGVPSAQSFGAVTIKTAVRPGVGGVPSAQAFGAPTIRVFQQIVVGAVPSAQSFGAATIKAVITRTVGGVSSAQVFGTVLTKTAIGVGGIGVNSAQAFGAITLRTAPVTIPVQGLHSAQSFGTEFFVGTKWLWDVHCIGTPDASICGEVICGDGHVCGGYSFDPPLPPPSDLPLVDTPITDLDLELLVCLGAKDMPICGLVVCGESICGGANTFIHPQPPVYDVDLEPVVCR